MPLAQGPKPLILALLFLAEFGSGLGVMILDITAGAIFAAVIPDRLRARVSGAYMVVNYGVRPLGALVGGALGSTIGLRPTLWLASAGALTGVLWLLPSPLPRLRVLPDAPEDGEGAPSAPSLERRSDPAYARRTVSVPFIPASAWLGTVQMYSTCPSSRR